MTLRFYFQLTKTFFRPWVEFLANNLVVGAQPEGCATDSFGMFVGLV